MEEFVIKSSQDDCIVEFIERWPEERSLPIEYYRVKLSRHDLFATARVWAGDEYYFSLPVVWFRDLADNWMGWEGEREWESIEHELRLSATNDRRGHIAMRVSLRSGIWDHDWRVSATIEIEAGQLDRLARHAASFFGKGFSQ